LDCNAITCFTTSIYDKMEDDFELIERQLCFLGKRKRPSIIKAHKERA
jgi:hypothetical protein